MLILILRILGTLMWGLMTSLQFLHPTDEVLHSGSLQRDGKMLLCAAELQRHQLGEKMLGGPVSNYLKCHTDSDPDTLSANGVRPQLHQRPIHFCECSDQPQDAARSTALSHRWEAWEVTAWGVNAPRVRDCCERYLPLITSNIGWFSSLTKGQ